MPFRAMVEMQLEYARRSTSVRHRKKPRRAPHTPRLPPELKAPRLDAYFVYPEEMRHSKRVSVFRDFLIAELTGNN